MRVDLSNQHRVHSGHQQVPRGSHRGLGSRITVLVVLEQRELEGALQGVQECGETLVQRVVQEGVLVDY